MPSAEHFFDAEQVYVGSSVGRILLTEQTDRWLHSLGPIIDCIRSIEINVHADKDKQSTVLIRKDGSHAPTSVDVLTARFNKLITEPEPESVISPLKYKIKAAEARKDFKGFSLEDVKDFASTFNVRT
ncbi:hypothetical protein LTR95_018180 [Oleoguttula sp. CCFEE 5521]